MKKEDVNEYFQRVMEEAKFDILQKRKNRQNSNRVILEILSDLIEKYPDARFGQILYKTGIIQQDKNGNLIDIFGEESDVTLHRMEENA